MNRVHIIGIGPGNKDYLLPIAKSRISKADTLIGARRLLSMFNHLDKEKIYLESDFDKPLAYIKKNLLKKRIAVLVSGDPGLYSFLDRLKQVLKKEEYVVIPGISSMQLAFARIGEAWQDVKIISLHGRKIKNLAKEVKTCAKIFLFTDSEFTPNKIAGYLIKMGIKNSRAVVFEQLGYPDEKIIDTDIRSLSKMKGFKLCVMLIKKEKASSLG